MNSDSDFARFKAIFEQSVELSTPAKGDNGPRFAAVAAPVEHVAGTLENVTPPGRAKKPVRTKSVTAALAEPLTLLPDMVARFVASAIERDAIHKRKEAGQAPPWTADPILANGHFCNVHREQDKVTRWITAHVIAPNTDDPDLVFKIALARFLNEPEALARLHWPAQFNLAQIHDVLKAHAAQGGKLFRTEAYKPPMPGKGEGTLPHLFEVVLPPIWREREELRPRDGDTLQAFCDRWRGCYKIGDFLAGQITADAKHVAPLFYAADWRTFAVPGPGSKRGLNRLCGRPIATSWSEAQWHATLLHLRSETEAAFAAAGLDPLDAQNVQNWLCEFDKYERARDAGGKPSRKYQAADAAPKAKAKRAKPAKAPKPVGPAKAPKPVEPLAATTHIEVEPPPQPEPATEPHCLAAALAYAARGWRIFPAVIKGKQKKSHKSAEHSGGERWGATRDLNQIRRDFTRWPGAMIGLPTDRDNGLFVMEADTKAGGHDHDGLAALDALVAQHGPLPETRIAESPSGSRHLYFRWPEGLTIKNATNVPAPGLDVRGDGGMVIAPPSLRNGKAYRWVCEAEIAKAPAWLLELIAAPKQDKPSRPAAADAELLGPLGDIEAAVDAITNDELGWEDWNTFGLAIYGASGGSEEGFAAFDRFSAKAKKYDADITRERWQALHGCPPNRIGFDFLASEAHKADPEWRLKAARANTARAAADGAREAGPKAGQEQQHGQRAYNAPPELISLRASTVQMEALTWLWPNRFALGKLGIIAGLPDEGKGLLAAYMTACCTNSALTWPCAEGKAPQGNVILLTAEDDIVDTVVPRLTAAGADLTRVVIVKQVQDTDKYGKPRRRMFNLARDLETLRREMTTIGNVVLIIIDPISAYLGRSSEVDSFRDTDVRSVLAPLQDLASDMRTAVVGLMHFNKKADVLNMLLRICNSIAFAAAARHAYGVVHDPDTKQQLLVRGKNNIARRDDRALAFRIEAREVGHDQRNGLPIEAPFLIWDADYVDITATEALQAVNENKAPGARNTAKRFLRELLRNGRMPVTEIEAARKAEGITKRTLERAKQDLGAFATNDGPGKPWFWQLPLA
jgi:hypothetical protein